MVAYIEYTEGPARKWYVGQEAGPLQDSYNINRTVAIQADGDELENIMRRFANIPRVTPNRVVTWYGDTAKFIVKHL